MLLNEFVNDILEYNLYDSDSSYRNSENQFEPETIHLFRSARYASDDHAWVDGIYVFKTSPRINGNSILPPSPAVYVAQADTPKDARELHRKLWNLGYAPFLIVLLPNQIRVYNTFDYSTQLTQLTRESGLLIDVPLLDHASLRDILKDFSANFIDTGRIWHSTYAQQLDANRRVDTRLLNNLAALAKALREDQNHPLPVEIAHALIGKYVYIRYLKDRNILSAEWLEQNSITLDNVFGHHATVDGLRRLVEALEARFNGDIFHIDFNRKDALRDSHVALVASVFEGHEFKSPTALQLRIDFKDFAAYDFRFIPIEALSSIYELFLHEENRGSEVGAYYTPEVLADYVLSEVHSVKPLTRGMRILDPSCGSGVFLVLAYRRLIELELANRNVRQLLPEELSKILLESIYGVEREADACSVTELSLILTLLHYLEPPELHKNTTFRFPNLRGERIFNCDFFDDNSKFWQLEFHFDWIVGNPPWIELKNVDLDEELFVRRWMAKNRREHPVAQGRVAEAFSWRVVDRLASDGVVGLIHHATSLFNTTSKKYRQYFFKEHKLRRITNFANLREFLFEGRATAPAATFIYQLATEKAEKPPIIHYGPFFINQIPYLEKKLWTITINENEIQTVSPHEAESGEAAIWKFALWGTYRDKRALERLRHLFPTTLVALCKKKGWPPPAQGSDLRDISEVPPEEQDKLEYRPDLIGRLLLDVESLNKRPSYLFSIPHHALAEKIPDNKCYIRKQGGDAGLKLTNAPHIFLSTTSWDIIVYSDQDFIIPPRQIGIAAASEQDANYLHALALYLRSSIVTYYIFFQVPAWGIFRYAKIVTIKEVKKIPVPEFTLEQVQQLADLHKVLVEEEQQVIKQAYFTSEVRAQLQAKLDENVFKILNIPKNLAILAREFVETRLLLNQGEGAIEQVLRTPSSDELLAYAQVLRDKLDDFVMGETYHRVKIYRSNDLIECVVEISRTDNPIPVSVETVNRTEAKILTEIRQLLGKQESQWVYVQRGLRVFQGSKAHIYKLSRLVEWTRTQALNDAADLIAEILSVSEHS